MLEELTPDDKEFILYLMSRLPVGMLSTIYFDFVHEKQMNGYRRNVKGKITNAEINRLELELKLYKFDKIIKTDIE